MSSSSPKPSGSPHALGPHGGVIVVIAAAVDEDADAAQGLSLHAAEAAVAVVAAVVDEDADARPGGALGDVLGLVDGCRLEVHEHRHAEDGAALHARAWWPGRRRCRARSMTSSTGRSSEIVPS